MKCCEIADSDELEKEAIACKFHPDCDFEELYRE
jgi:hypothetical protein